MARADDHRDRASTTSAGSIDELWKLVDGIEVAMLTTRRIDGHMVSRPMATQKRAAGADFWFATMKDLPKVAEILADPRVNLSYYKDRTTEWVSISGEAEISRDRDKIRELWEPDWKFWFPDEGKGRDGSADDERIALIGVRAVSAQYMTLEKPAAFVLFDLVKSKLTGRTPEIGEVKRLRLSSASRRTSPAGRTRARARASGRRVKRTRTAAGKKRTR